jgi:hypothetical protein
VPCETFAPVTRFLPGEQSRTHGPEPAAAAGSSISLFACLRRGLKAARLDSAVLKTAPRHSSPHFIIAREFSPRIECHGPSTVVLDVSGLGRLLGDAHAIGAELARVAAGDSATLRIAIARTQTAARLVAIGSPGPTVADGDVAAAIAALPLDTLRVFVEDDEVDGASAARLEATTDRLETFRRWGLTMLGEIAALPSMDLSERMGQEGLALQQLARGIDPVPLVPDPGVPRFMESMELEWPSRCRSCSRVCSIRSRRRSNAPIVALRRCGSTCG